MFVLARRYSTLLFSLYNAHMIGLTIVGKPPTSVNEPLTHPMGASPPKADHSGPREPTVSETSAYGGCAEA